SMEFLRNSRRATDVALSFEYGCSFTTPEPDSPRICAPSFVLRVVIEMSPFRIESLYKSGPDGLLHCDFPNSRAVPATQRRNFIWANKVSRALRWSRRATSLRRVTNSRNAAYDFSSCCG